MVRKFAPLWAVLLLVMGSCNGSWIPLQLDQTLGEQSKQEIENNPEQFVILEEEAHPEAYRVLRDIRTEILNSGQVTHKNDFPWELKIVQNDSVKNAFCLPGGYIYVFTGLIKFLDSEDALAGVLGHEIAHADMRHSSRQLVKNMGLSLALQLIFGGNESGLVDLGANLLSLSFSRSDEQEADSKSVEYLYPTRFDARGAAWFFQKMENNEQEPSMLEFASTHPNPENRIENIQHKWKEMGSKKPKAKKGNYKILLNDLP